VHVWAVHVRRGERSRRDTRYSSSLSEAGAASGTCAGGGGGRGDEMCDVEFTFTRPFRIFWSHCAPAPVRASDPFRRPHAERTTSNLLPPAVQGLRAHFTHHNMMTRREANRVSLIPLLSFDTELRRDLASVTPAVLLGAPSPVYQVLHSSPSTSTTPRPASSASTSTTSTPPSSSRGARCTSRRAPTSAASSRTTRRYWSQGEAGPNMPAARDRFLVAVRATCPSPHSPIIRLGRHDGQLQMTAARGPKPPAWGFLEHLRAR
jgi:hypothetical protein